MKTFNPSDHISVYFTYHEALWLKQWGRHGGSSDGLTDEVLLRLAGLFCKMDKIREYFNAPMDCHDAWRPMDYNNIIHGAAADSTHMARKLAEAALDFDVVGFNCDTVRDKILQAGLLDRLGLRMEDRPGSDWIHLDTRIPLVGHSRFFKP